MTQLQKKKIDTILTTTYNYVNKVPIKSGKDALDTNWCEIIITNEDGKKVQRGETWHLLYVMVEKDSTYNYTKFTNRKCSAYFFLLLI